MGDFNYLFFPLRFLVSFWSFQIFRLFWLSFFLLFVLNIIHKIVRSKF